MAVINPVGPNLKIDTANTVSVATTQQTPYLRVVAIGASHAHVAIGSAPTATANDFVAVKDVPSIISLGQPRSQPLVGVTTGTETRLRIQEGEGSQFVKGQQAILTDCDDDTSDPYWKNAIGVCTVLSIDDRINFPNNPYPHNVEIVVSGDSSLIQTSFSSNSRLVSAFQVSALTGGAEGYVHCQQVQITGG